MSGHSKWHNIQARKGKQDAKKSGEFTKLAKLIAIAAQKGGDPTMNFSLRLAIEKAKALSMPKDNIERAIKRGTGEDGAGLVMEEVVYEAFGPGGVAILIKAVTDNKNRAISDIKHILSENNGSFAGPGSVQWMFQQWGVIVLTKESVKNRDEFELTMIENGAEDIVDIDESVELKTKVENFKKVLDTLKELNIEPKDSSIQWIAKDPVTVAPDIEEKLGELFSGLEANDDVEDYFTNAA